MGSTEKVSKLIKATQPDSVWESAEIEVPDFKSKMQDITPFNFLLKIVINTNDFFLVLKNM